VNLRPAFSRGVTAFSLVEVVLALGVIAFALIAITGLFSFGLKTGQESVQRTHAGNLAAGLLSMWRATNLAANFPLPPLSTSITSPISNTTPIRVSVEGTTTIAGLPDSDIYNLRYRVAPGAASHVFNVYLLLWWPAQEPSPTPGHYYEITTEIDIP
jgi:type II secretory pathway pseudopilin PulG